MGEAPLGFSDPYYYHRGAPGNFIGRGCFVRYELLATILLADRECVSMCGVCVCQGTAVSCAPSCLVLASG